MDTVNHETVLQIVTILGGTIALLLAVLQIVETYLDIAEKLHKRRLKQKGRSRAK